MPVLQRLSVVRAEPEVREPQRDAGQGRRADIARADARLMQLLAGLVVPAAIVLVVALVTRHVLRRRGVSAPGRIGALALTGGVLLATLVAVIVLVKLDDNYNLDCDESASRWPLGIAYYLALL